MKKITFLLVAMLFSTMSWAQCPSGAAYQGAAATSDGIAVALTTCAFAGEHSPVTGGMIIGNDYEFVGTGGTGNYLTFTDSSGNVIAHGPSPLTVNAITVTSGRVYVSTNAACGTDSSCHTLTVRCVSASCVPPPPPANDDCAGALVLPESTLGTCDNTISGTTFFATASSEADCSTTNWDVWYTFTPSSTGVYNLSVTETFDPSFASTYVSIFEGACGGLTQVGTACTSATTSATLTSGNTYYVNVRSTSTANGVEFNLCASLAPPPPANDDCAGALVLTESSVGSCDNFVSGTTISATASSETDCSTTNLDVWYTFTPSLTGAYNLSVTETFDPASASTYVSVFEGSCGGLTQVGTACFSTALTVSLTLGNTYYVNVRSTSTSSGVNFNLCATPLPTAVPTNDLCSTAIALTPGAIFDTNPVAGYTTNSTGSGELPLPGCAVYDPADTSGFGGDVWYSVVVPADGNLTVQTNGNPTGSVGDSGIAVYSGVCGTLALVECNDDDSPDGLFSQVVIESTDNLAGQTVYVRVWEYSGDAPLNFQISAFSSTLSSPDTETGRKFTYYPNPVKNTLQLNAQSNIQNVSVYNMLGQEVLRTAPNNVNSTVDMSALQTGAYFVKVTINDKTEMVRIIKN